VVEPISHGKNQSSEKPGGCMRIDSSPIATGVVLTSPSATFAIATTASSTSPRICTAPRTTWTFAEISVPITQIAVVIAM
jgi:hypothetical protein